jgi:hypothetical protein
MGFAFCASTALANCTKDNNQNIPAIPTTNNNGAFKKTTKKRRIKEYKKNGI